MFSEHRRLRILHIAGLYPPDYGGGAAVFVRDLCQGMANRGHDTRVVCSASLAARPYTVHTEWDGQVQIERVNVPYFFKDPEGWQLGLREWIAHEHKIGELLGELVGSWEPDIVQHHAARTFGEVWADVMLARGIPMVAMFHDAWLICPRRFLERSPQSDPCSGPGPIRCLECMYSHYDKRHLKALAKLPWRAWKQGVLQAYRLRRRRRVRTAIAAGIGYSQFMTDMHREHLNGVTRYIPLGINLDGLPTSLRHRPGRPVRFGFVGGFQPIKGVWDILDAADAMKRSGLSFELRIWGPHRQEDLHEITNRNLDNEVVVCGMYSTDEMWSVYDEIDVALMATRASEPLGRVPQEAAAVGAPTIAPAIGGITEQIRHDVDGLLYRFQDKNDLEHQMRRVLTEPDLLPRLISNVRQPPDTREAVVKVEEFYYEVLERLGRTPTKANAATLAPSNGHGLEQYGVGGGGGGQCERHTEIAGE